MIIEYAEHGSLKDFLKSCEDVVLKLNHSPQVKSFRTRRTSLVNSSSGACPHQVYKMPLSAQNSVFSSAGTPTPLITTNNSSNKLDLLASSNNIMAKFVRNRLITQDSGFFGENVDSASQATLNGPLGGSAASMSHSMAPSMAPLVAPLTHDYDNSRGLIYMEDVQNFVLQIACGLKHLEDCQVGWRILKASISV